MLAGFCLIALAWILQLAYIVRGNRNVQPTFIGVYVAGVIILTASDVIGGALDIAYAELITIIASLLALAALLITQPSNSVTFAVARMPRTRKARSRYGYRKQQFWA